MVSRQKPLVISLNPEDWPWHAFLEGPAGSGKTSTAVAWLLNLLENGIPASEILVLLPQRTLATPYEQALLSYSGAGGLVSIITFAGLARGMVELFWPLIAEQAGFARPDDPPTFLTLETAQYYMAFLVQPLLEAGYFESLVMDRNRLYSQILDNLNKAAVIGFPHTEIGQRLSKAWNGDPGQLRIYQDAQDCANRFRAYCLEHNLLDFSLQLEVFSRYLWRLPACRTYLRRNYHHLIYDNLEEDTPLAHDLLGEWLPDFDTALLIYDQDAGYRRFLGADPQSAYALKGLCRQHLSLTETFVSSPAIQTLASHLSQNINGNRTGSSTRDNPLPALVYETNRFYPQMLDWVTDQIADLVHREKILPGNIAVLAPFLSDALRFALTNRLENLGIPSRSHRPSRSLGNEPVTHCLLTLAALAHPQWEIRPSKFDLAYALMQAIEALDLVRARLLVEIVYRPASLELTSYDQIIPAMQERITYRLGERFEHLRQWLADYRQSPPLELDHFLGRIFGEVLSQPGFGFHVYYDAGQVTANLIESIQKFRWVVGPALLGANIPLGKEYLRMVKEGLIAAQYLLPWKAEIEDAVLLAPAYTFLMSNRPVDVQFWLDVGSRAWAERINQPLTHPYVLSRSWPAKAQWTAAEEFESAQDNLYRLALGLLRRCRLRLYLGLSELGEQGFEQRGPLLNAFQRLLRDLLNAQKEE